MNVFCLRTVKETRTKKIKEKDTKTEANALMVKVYKHLTLDCLIDCPASSEVPLVSPNSEGGARAQTEKEASPQVGKNQLIVNKSRFTKPH